MSGSGLIIRSNERLEISLPVRVRVAAAHAEAVKFSRGMTQEDRWIEAHLIDFSMAGAGLMCTAFFPKGTTLELDIPAPGEDAQGSLFGAEVRVMRVQMTDRRPAYLVGTSFVAKDERSSESVARVMSMLRGEDGDA